jgi:hypothetical protein
MRNAFFNFSMEYERCYFLITGYGSFSAMPDGPDSSSNVNEFSGGRRAQGVRGEGRTTTCRPFEDDKGSRQEITLLTAISTAVAAPSMAYAINLARAERAVFLCTLRA